MSYIIAIAIVLIILYQIGKHQQKSKIYKPVSFKVQTSFHTETKHKDDSKWEIVHRKTKRWTDLGFGDGDNFPGYGRLYDREFKVWYCEIGSKDIKDERIIRDRFPLHYDPKNSHKITGEGVYLNRLYNTKGYESLYSGLDNQNRKRWYFALTNFSPTWIETDRAIEKENTEIEKEELKIPKGWELVRNHSEKWIELGYDQGFPGYGKIYDISFEVWYSIVGSKEKVFVPSISVHLALYSQKTLYYFERACYKIEELNGTQIQFNRLSRSQTYNQLYSGLDNSTKKRWYLGVKEMKPTFYFTANAECY